MPEHGDKRRGRVYDATYRGGRWFKDGYAPFQLPEVIRMDCGRCGGKGTLLAFRTGVNICTTCAPMPVA